MSKARSRHRRGLQRTVALIAPRLVSEHNVLLSLYTMHSVSRQAVCSVSAAFRVSSAPPRRCAVSHVRELQTARQSYFGASSSLKQPVVTRKSGELCEKKLTAFRCNVARGITPDHHDGSIAVLCRGFLPPSHGLLWCHSYEGHAL